MASYEAIREHLYPEIDWDAAFPPEVRERHKRGELAVWFTLNGFFWFPRTLLGIERHLYAFYDQPELMRRINDDLLSFNKYLLKGIANIIEPEFMTFAEDLSYNHGPMLSKALFTEFLTPYYREMTPLVRAKTLSRWSIRTVTSSAACRGSSTAASMGCCRSSGSRAWTSPVCGKTIRTSP